MAGLPPITQVGLSDKVSIVDMRFLCHSWRGITEPDLRPSGPL